MSISTAYRKATIPKVRLYGTDRMLRALNYNRDSDMKKLLLSVMTSIREFSSGAEQFDDITMVGLRWA